MSVPPIDPRSPSTELPAGPAQGPDDAAPTRRGLLRLGAGLAAAAPLAACRSTSTGAAEEDEAARLDELFADLQDQSGSVAPIGEPERAQRRARLAERLAVRGVDAYLCEAGPAMTYLAGVSWGRSERLFALIVTADGRSLWICPAFEESRARRRIDGSDDRTGPGGDVVVWQEHEYAWRPLAAALGERGVERVAVDPLTRHFVPARLGEELGPGRVVDGEVLSFELRSRKSATEQALQRRANELTQEALVAVSEHLRPGTTGAELGAMVRAAQERLGLHAVWVLPLIGPEGAFPHGAGLGTPLEPGSMVLVDTGGSLHDYQSDETRSWVFGRAPTAEQERVWYAVRDAQLAAFGAIRPGRACREIDALARASLDAAGFGPGYRYFTHRLGHGIGLQGHEAPYFDGGSDVVLAPGMTLSDEPGVYLPGRFGVRLEDIVVVTEDGADHFGDWQRSPRSPRS